MLQRSGHSARVPVIVGEVGMTRGVHRGQRPGIGLHVKRAFHLSKLTGQTIPIMMRNSRLIITFQSKISQI